MIQDKKKEAIGDKNSLMGEQNLLEYFFTCPNMTNSVGKIHEHQRASSS